MKSFIVELMKTFLIHTAPLNIREIKGNWKSPSYATKQKKTLKTSQDSSGIYIRGMIRKFYGTTVRPPAL